MTTLDKTTRTGVAAALRRFTLRKEGGYIMTSFQTYHSLSSRVKKAVQVSAVFLTAGLFFLLLTPAAQAQGGVGGLGGPSFGIGGAAPFLVQLTGYINGAPKEAKALATLTVGVPVQGKTYNLALTDMQAVNQPRVTSASILREVSLYSVNFFLSGSEEMISRITQTPPEKPVTFLAYIRPRSRDLVIMAVNPV